MLINPNITIQEPKRNKQWGYYVTPSEDNTGLKIKAKSSNGRSRGFVGTIHADGFIVADKKVHKSITPTIRQKIDFVLDLAFGSKRDAPCFDVRIGMIELVKRAN
jgi:hypothetical protein